MRYSKSSWSSSENKSSWNSSEKKLWYNGSTLTRKSLVTCMQVGASYPLYASR